MALICIMLLGWYIPRDWQPSQIIFCALFLLVFAIAVRYRHTTAYITGLLTTVCYGLFIWFHPTLHVSIGTLDSVLKLFLLLMSGALISDILQAQRRRSHAFEQNYLQANTELQKLTRRYQMALTINEELQQQVAGQPSSVASISDKMLLLWQSNHTERYAVILD